jgi:prepilin peptidase CpaA
MQTNIAGLAAGALFAIPLIAALVSDLRSLRIPNWVSLALIAGFFAYAWLLGGGVDVRANLIAAGVAFAATFCLYIFGWFGAGDVKLLTTVTLWAGPQHSARLILIVALAGGAIAILIISTRWAMKVHPIIAIHLPRQVKRWARHGVFPYSIPIVIGAISLLPAIIRLGEAAVTVR